LTAAIGASRKIIGIARMPPASCNLCKNAHQFITNASKIIPMERWQFSGLML
jgi:hypothetical protein